MIKVNVKFIKRLYGTPDSEYSVFSAEPATYKDKNLVKENRYGNFKIVGEFSLDDSEIGAIYTVTLKEEVGSRYPNSYKLIKIHYELPKGAKEQWEYLRNGNIVPLGTYLSIENTFSQSDKILDIMMNEPSELTKVRGIGDSRAKNIQSKLLANNDKAVIFAEYGDIEGVGTKIINFLVDWKPNVLQTIKTIKKDPFSLLESPSIGFMLADKFRMHYGLPLNDRNRILHGVSYYLKECFQNTGNTYEDIFLSSKQISSKLFVPYEEILVLLAEIQKDEEALKKYQLKIFGKNITTRALFNAELLIYKEVKSSIINKEKISKDDTWKSMKNDLLSSLPQDLSDEQDQFLDLINNEKISILLGPGGSGKSWVINLACELIKKSGKTFALYAPTARAAHVMSNYVDADASTIHRGLMTTVAQGETVDYDVLIVDEFSMVDSELASVVLKAMGIHTRLIIVGDDFQLQSVGPGNVLFDLVEFIDVPTIKLTKIFRQSEGSHILDYANDLREGTFRLPLDRPRVEEQDIVFINEPDDSRQQEIALALYKKSYDRYGVDDIMLLSPTNKGVYGRGVLNKKVQAIVNPSINENDVIFGAKSNEEDKKTFYKKGDYITVKSNHYDMINDYDEITQIINGDLGDISQTYKTKLTFEINGHPYTIDKSEIHDLIEHAWTITIHKSQGGQASEVIIVLPTNSYFMLNANMLYTAITRAKVKCYVIGSFKGINEAAKEQANLRRKTMIQLQSLAKDNGNNK
ncbi:MAG TPA: AAA family ATPase [Clostridiales bacterium]|nr:AAA family ATPase [Clostridiales bacterium]